VNKEELIHQLVFVLNISMKLNKKEDVPLVNLVHIGVMIVVLLIFVIIVKILTELMHQYVTAQMVTMMEVIKNAYHVTGDVKHVLVTHKIVSIVKMIDTKHHTVLVLIQNMKNSIYNLVNHVTEFVLLVLILHTTVLTVFMAESILQFVNVHQVSKETLKIHFNVFHVLLNVVNVPVMEVVSVLLTESIHQNVTVEMDTIMMEMLNVHHVTIIVKPVQEIETSVSLVEETELTPQLVTVHTDTSITSLILNVKYVVTCVKLVKPLVKIVGLVPKTELIHHLVTVQITGIMPLTSVKNVLTNVPNVLLLNLIVVLVLVTELMLHNVYVHMVLMMFQVNLSVNLVPHNVMIVMDKLTTVAHVLVTECLPQFVIAHQVP
jgi:hypothetical protein